MDQVTVVEILDGRNRVTQRVRVTEPVFTIGRSLENAVILDDPHVDPLHAEIRLPEVENEPYTVSDLNSTNGTVAAGSRLAPGSVALVRDGQIVRVGSTNLRLVSPVTAPSSTVVMHRRFLADFRPGPIKAIAACVAAVGFSLLFVYLAWYGSDPAVTFAATGIGMLSLLLVWGGVWAVGNRLFAGRFNFWAHLTIAALAVIGLMIGGDVHEFLDFVIPGWFTDHVIGTGGGILFIVVPLMAHLDVASGKSMRFKGFVAAGVVAAIGSLALLGTLSMDSQADEVYKNLGTLRGFPETLPGSESVDAFAEELTELHADLTAE